MLAAPFAECQERAAPGSGQVWPMLAESAKIPTFPVRWRWGVAWTVPRFRAAEYNTAANVLLAGKGDVEAAEDIVNNFRSSHSYPLNTFQIGLRRLAPQDALIAQRLKRLPSILAKLELRRETMKLSQMQDIGGC